MAALGVALFFVLSRLQQAVQLVGVAGAPGFDRLASLVFRDCGRDNPATTGGSGPTQRLGQEHVGQFREDR